MRCACRSRPTSDPFPRAGGTPALALPVENRRSGRVRPHLATWEAAANAVEHPDESLEPVIELTAEGDRNGVCVTVRDFGRWRPVRLAADRELGLRLIEGLMDEAEMTPSDEGTIVRMRRRRRRALRA